MSSEIEKASVIKYAPSSLGKVQTQLTIRGFRITQAEYSARTKLPPHAHRDASVTVVLNGGFSERFRRTNEVCEPRSILIKPPGAVHANVYGDAPTKCLLIAISEPPKSIGGLFEQTSRFVGGKVYSLALALGQELRSGDDLAEIAAEGLILEMLAASAREVLMAHEYRSPLWLRRLRDHLQENCLQKIGGDTIAEISGVHPVYAAKTFRRYYGCAPMDFVRRCRIDWAVDALLRTSLSIGEISQKAGFSDQSHFTRAFTRRVGRTPGVVRRIALI